MSLEMEKENILSSRQGREEKVSWLGGLLIIMSK
uniref:Uncharacterized protein n=1 Tax=Arundo donax TaxID=35708 RepID=A0A0A9GD07_ARUDO